MYVMLVYLALKCSYFFIYIKGNNAQLLLGEHFFFFFHSEAFFFVDLCYNVQKLTQIRDLGGCCLRHRCQQRRHS